MNDVGREMRSWFSTKMPVSERRCPYANENENENEEHGTSAETVSRDEQR